MEVKDIIAKGRPSASVAHLPEFRYIWGVHNGYEYAIKEFENNRLKACESQTEAESERELNFAIKFFEEHHRQPTFSDAIEITRKQVTDKACKIYCDNICERSRCGMCYYKYDHKAQVKNDFKYSECETLKMFRKDMED